MMAKEWFYPSYKFLHNFPEFLKQVLWRYIPDTPHVQYWYAESEHYILKFPNGTYGFVMAKSPMEAYDNFVKENSKEKKMKERCIILNGNGTKNIVPVERIALVSFKETGKTFEATFYIDNAITVTIGGLTTEGKDKIIDIMQYKV